MADEPTKDEVDRLAKEMAQRVMSKPHQPQTWPKKPAGHDKADGLLRILRYFRGVGRTFAPLVVGRHVARRPVVPARRSWRRRRSTS